MKETCPVFDARQRGLPTNNISATLLGMYHTGNLSIYTPKYITLSTDMLITSYKHTFLSFQDGDTLHTGYIKFIATILYLFYILTYFKPYTYL